MEQVESDFKTLFHIFYEVLRFCEGYYSSVDSKILFKSAKAVEDTYLKLKRIGALIEFESKLNEFWALKGLNAIPLKFFKHISHIILSKFLSDSIFTDFEVKLAVTQFLFNRQEKEFVEVVHRLNQTRQSVEILKQSIIRSGNISAYNTALCLGELKKCLATNHANIEEVDYIITKIICDDKSSFKIILKMLCLSNDCELSINVQELVAVSINNLLRDSENIYLYSYILELCNEDFHHIITHWRSFTDTFFRMIEFSVGHLCCVYSGRSYSWNCLGTEKGLSFLDTTALINKLKLLPDVCGKLKVHLQRLKEEGFGMIAEDLMRICKIE